MIVQHELARARDDLTWLAAHGALGGIAAIIAERRRWIEGDGKPPGRYAAETALHFGERAKAGALIAAQIDSEARP